VTRTRDSPILFQKIEIDFEKENRANHAARGTEKKEKLWFIG